jgi:murein DD-endopeptidase MepM/ murein hydrolase activator NlpD
MPKQDVIPATRWSRNARRSLVLILLALAGCALWQSGIVRQLRLAWQLQGMPAPTSLPVPVDGIAAKRIADTWGGARSGGRHHQGVDIFARRGTVVRSTTPGLVLRIADFGIGGKHVWILGPAGERHYYAHLDDWAPGLVRGERVEAGTPLGVVGDTGNAKGTPPHLHYGIYDLHGAHNPWPLLQASAP